jgi:hypothetical protein
MAEFEAFNKIPRLSRECVITEKIDGTNAQVLITDEGEVYAGSRSRFITPQDDNFGFAKWVDENKEELLKLGPGRHFGEWWGLGIQRNYGLQEKRFSLFNVGRWNAENVPACCSIVPVLYQGLFSTLAAQSAINDLIQYGSHAAPGFMKPEGIIIYHTASGQLFKKTCEKDEQPKGKAA